MVLDPSKIGLKVGLEIHQQLATKGKLFCDCYRNGEELNTRFERRLRPTQSELGEIDPTATFEFKKGLVNRYFAGETTSCLVEADEEPPHELNLEAVEAAIVIAKGLNSSIVDEIHVMRKIVIDGSNTTGFQRTAVVAVGGALKIDGKEVLVQTITLEEDAARLVGEGEGYREFALDRLGIPLIEVSLAPITAGPEEVKEVALALGRLMRSTGKVARGLGTIRQDLNISVAGGKVIEVKGVQKLEDLSSIIRYEMERQAGLMKIAEELSGTRKLGPEDFKVRGYELSEILKNTECSILKNALYGGGMIFGLGINGFVGAFGLEPFPGIRLGKEISEMVRFYGLGGIFHSDELPGYGISGEEVAMITKSLELTNDDGFVILAGKKTEVEEASRAVAERCRQALFGVTSETRGPAPDGKTKYIRPRPGAARMYPETDIPIVAVTSELLQRATSVSWKGWDEQVKSLEKEYGLSPQLALSLFDSDYLELFRKVVSVTEIAPSFVAASIAETLTSLSRAGFDLSSLTDEALIGVFSAVGQGLTAKEGVPTILEALLSGKARNAEDAVRVLGLGILSDMDLEDLVNDIVAQNRKLVEKKGERALSTLMGIVMGRVRGKADGKKVSVILKDRIQRIISDA